MNTTIDRIPSIPKIGASEYEILLGDLEFAMNRQQLLKIMAHWNGGKDIEEIGEIEQRNPIEVLLALMHQARKGYELRSFARRL